MKHNKIRKSDELVLGQEKKKTADRLVIDGDWRKNIRVGMHRGIWDTVANTMCQDPDRRFR
jgi:hypothetical protein